MANIKNVTKGQVVTIKGELNIKPDITNPKSGVPKPYFRASINDKSEKMYFMIWSESAIYEEMKKYVDGDTVEAEVTVEKDSSGNNKYISGSINSIKKIEPIGLRGVVDQNALTDELREELKSIKHEGISKLIKNVFSREDVKTMFFIAPATEKSGYSFESGTLAHVIRTIRLSKAVANIFNSWEHNVDGYKVNLNIDLLKACAILHDIGKLKAYKFDGNKIVKTKEGELFEDAYLGAKILIEELPKIELLEEERILLEHAITSSKDRLAFGSLNVPRTPEAIAFHQIEKLDADMATFEYLYRTALSSKDFVKLFEKTFYPMEFDEV